MHLFYYSYAIISSVYARGYSQKMRRLYGVISSVLLAVMTLVFFVAPHAQAVNPPTLMNFQGRLTNTAGNIVADGSYNMIFSIYSAASGGTQLWTETRDTTNRVAVTSGLFSVKLGEVNPLSANIFESNSALYFDIQLANPATATCSTAGCATYEAPMTPRSQLATSAYAFSATSAESAVTATSATNATNLGGIAAANYARQDVANTFAGANTFNSTVLHSVNSTSALLVQNTTATPFLTVDTSSATGEVQIGSPTVDANAIQLALDSSSAEPTGINGGMYYNTTKTTNRCYLSGAWQDCGALTKKLTADVSNNTTTIANVTGLSFPVAASTDYRMRCSLMYRSAATTTGIKVSVTGPATPTAVTGMFTTYVSAAAAATVQGGLFRAYDGGAASSGVDTINVDTPGVLDVTFRNGANAGTLQVRFNSEVGTSNVTIKAGSSCDLYSL